MEMPIRSPRLARKAQALPDTAEQHARLRKAAKEVRILDPGLIDAFIRDRQEKGIDGPDETWEGVYTVPPLPTLSHQSIVSLLTAILFNVVSMEGRGRVFPGANVSDRREGWEHKFRGPDVVVTTADSQAQDCGTHWMGGPDFLVEVQSPRDETEDKIPFYSDLKVRELLIIQRDTLDLRLYRHNGKKLAPVKFSNHAGGKRLVSRVVPLAFRRAGTEEAPKLEIARTDGTAGSWTV
jgi:Uma2 family endonuclease